tara:strand:+ start:202 stop:1110 length:909 start_codon:yes stop_codon:yes gene_type:complete
LNIISTKSIISFLGEEKRIKDNFNVKSIKPPDELVDHALTFLSREEEFDELFRSAPQKVLAVIPASLEKKSKGFPQTFIYSKNPRLTFAKILNNFFNEQTVQGIAKSAIIETDGIIHNTVAIGEHCSIRGEIDIGEFSEIYDNVTISGNVFIGKNVRIKSGTVIGQKGFGFVLNENKIPIGIPHFGSVVIGDNVELGALNTVVQGTLGDTIISDNVKTDDHVHIAHGVKIGKNTLITACVEISGSVDIGENVWIGPNSSIIDHIQIGDNVFIGIGAVVTKSLTDAVVAVGNPAKVIKKNNTN